MKVGSFLCEAEGEYHFQLFFFSLTSLPFFFVGSLRELKG